MTLPWKHNNSSVTDVKERDICEVSENDLIDKKSIMDKNIKL